MTTDTILCDRISGHHGDLGCLTLNRPQALNALNHPMITAITEQLLAWRDDDSIKAVIIKAVPGRAFCAGGDVRCLQQIPKSEALAFFADEYRMNQLIFNYPKPYIALLDGITMGGGAGVSIHGALRIASEQLLFAMPETSIGFFPDIGASYFLSRIPQQLGTYLGLTGHAIDIADALALGLVDHQLPSHAFDDLVKQLASTDLGTEVHGSIATIVRQFSQPAAPSALQQHATTIADIFSLPTIAAIFDALAERDDAWSQQTLATLQTKSPTSLQVSLKQLHGGLRLSFDNCMRTEFGLTQHFLQHPDFAEGVRAQLIDKDKQPQWQPASTADIDTFFNTNDTLPLEFIPS